MHYYIGMMSGTSMDAIDSALIAIEKEQIRCVSTYAHPIPKALLDRLRRLANPQQLINLDEYGLIDAQVGELFANAALQLLAQSGLAPEAIRAIGSHGQTVRHRPEALPGFSLQLGNAHYIAQKTGITTIADFRTRDLTVGGQGAPLVPAFHRAFLHSLDESRVVLNIGGIANITVLPQEISQRVTGFDTGPGNTLLDAWIRRHQDKSYDNGGAWALTGTLQPDLLQALLADPYCKHPPPKSTGTEYFNLDWLDQYLKTFANIPPEDVQRTLVEFTALSIAAAIENTCTEAKRILVCGGGVHNRLLLHRLEVALPGKCIVSTGDYGLEPDWVEALCFAWLAHLCLEHRPANLPEVTGATESVILGAIYPSCKNLLEKN